MGRKGQISDFFSEDLEKAGWGTGTIQPIKVWSLIFFWLQKTFLLNLLCSHSRRIAASSSIGRDTPVSDPSFFCDEFKILKSHEIDVLHR
jgi:hypothetical protein